MTTSRPSPAPDTGTLTHALRTRHDSAGRERDRERLPEETDPLAVLEWSRAHVTSLPRPLRGEDVRDRLRLITALRRELDRQELAALDAGTTCGLTNRQLSAVLGRHSRNAAHARRLRLIAALNYPDEPRHPDTVRRHDRGRRSVQTALTRDRAALRDAARAVISHRDAYPVDDWLDDLAELLEQPETDKSSASTAAYLRLFLTAVTGHAARHGTGTSDSQVARDALDVARDLTRRVDPSSA